MQRYVFMHLLWVPLCRRYLDHARARKRVKQTDRYRRTGSRAESGEEVSSITEGNYNNLPSARFPVPPRHLFTPARPSSTPLASWLINSKHPIPQTISPCLSKHARAELLNVLRYAGSGLSLSDNRGCWGGARRGLKSREGGRGLWGVSGYSADPSPMPSTSSRLGIEPALRVPPTETERGW